MRFIVLILSGARRLWGGAAVAALLSCYFWVASKNCWSGVGDLLSKKNRAYLGCILQAVGCLGVGSRSVLLRCGLGGALYEFAFASLSVHVLRPLTALVYCAQVSNVRLNIFSSHSILSGAPWLGDCAADAGRLHPRHLRFQKFLPREDRSSLCGGEAIQNHMNS